MMQLVTLAVLGAAMADVGGEQQWTVGVEMGMSEATLDEKDGTEDLDLTVNHFAVVGTWRPIEMLSVSLRLGFAEVPMVFKEGSAVVRTAVFDDARLWGLEVGSGGALGAGDLSWDAGLKLEGIFGVSYYDDNDRRRTLKDHRRLGLYGNIGMSWGDLSAYGGLRLTGDRATYRDRNANKTKFESSSRLGLVVGMREQAGTLSYSFELGFLDSLTATVGTSISF